MTIFVLAPTKDWNHASGYASPRTMLDKGLLAAYSLRNTGTLRHLELAPVSSTRRDTAEWISEQMGDGLAVKAVARELHVSVATVRRFLLSLELTEQIEAGEWEDLYFQASTGEPQWLELPSQDEEVDDEPVGEDEWRPGMTPISADASGARAGWLH